MKDFTDEEKAVIIARLKKARPAKVAKEFGTTWQTVRAIKKADDERALDLVRADKNRKKNKVLKMKVNALTEQVEKLRAAIKELVLI